MLSNFLTNSGNVTSISGNDAYAPYPYWDTYTYRQLNSTEIDSLKDNDYLSGGVTFSPNQYTCLEITTPEPIYIGSIRLYGPSQLTNMEVGVVIPQLSHTLSHQNLNLLTDSERENLQGEIVYWDQIDANRGYFETTQIPLVSGSPVTLVSANYDILYSATLSGELSGVAGKTVKQILKGNDVPAEFISVHMSAGSTDLTLSDVTISPMNTENYIHTFTKENTLDDDVRDRIRYWVADTEGGEYGHFEGRDIWLDVGSGVIGKWDQYTTWSGNYSREQLAGYSYYTFRQVIPNKYLASFGDGIRVTFSGCSDRDILLNGVSYMQASSNTVTLDFQNNSSFLQYNIKGIIDRWKNDGFDINTPIETLQGATTPTNIGDYIDSQRSKQYGHFEGTEIDVDDDTEAIMYDANVIGIMAQNHGLVPGDYIRIYGTEYYDGYYQVLTYSTAHIVVIWGIYDPETFYSSAKIRKVISLGPEIDFYGRKQDCRDVLPSVQINMANGSEVYITNYSSYGLGHSSVELSDIIETGVVTSIYDVDVDSSGWLTSMPGPDNNQEWQTSMPYAYQKYFKARKKFTKYSTAWTDPSRGYTTQAAEAYDYSGKISLITEADDPEFEGDWTGSWDARFFDRIMAQPWSILIADGCPFQTLCYRGPMPVKFIFDLQTPKILNKYRMWIQLLLCPKSMADGIPAPLISKPKSWKIQGSNVNNNDDIYWTTLHEVTDFNPDDFMDTAYPPDKRVPLSCANSEWLYFRNTELYRYYRLYVYEVWIKALVYDKNPYGVIYSSGVETTHIDELDLCERRAAPGIFPTVVTSDLFADTIDSVLPLEHLRDKSKIFYCLSFDDGDEFKIYNGVDWITTVRNNGGTWQYLYNDIFYNAEDNNVRRALWQAFSIPENRMDYNSLSRINTGAYTLATPSGTYLQIGIGLLSEGVIEPMLEGIEITGIIYNPVGQSEPYELTFSGATGINIPAGEKVTSDWINADVLPTNDILIVMDTDSSASGISRFTVDRNPKYFERRDAASYDLQNVSSSLYTMKEGVVLIDSIEVRQSSTVIIPAATNDLLENSMVSLSGTEYYNGLHTAVNVAADTFEIVSKHNPETIISGAVVHERLSIGANQLQPEVQVGSLVEFSEPGGYWSTDYQSTQISGYYTVTESNCVVGYEATHLFDPSITTWFHSGQTIEDGPIHIGLNTVDFTRQYNKIRLRSAYNEDYWLREFPRGIRISACSSSSTPTLTSEVEWTLLVSGTCSLPIGAGRFNEWIPFTNSGDYNWYRLSFDSNYGSWYDCVRLSEIEIADDIDILKGCGLIGEIPGFDAKYLLDSQSYTQYVSSGTIGLGALHIGLDARNRPKKLNRFQVKSISSAITDTSDDPWLRVSPKDILVYGSNIAKPTLNTDTGWTLITTTGIALPQAGAVYSSWVGVVASDNYTTPTIKSPTMTGYTTPAPYSASATSIRGTFHEPWRAFDRDISDSSYGWASSSILTLPQSLSIYLGSPIIINAIRLRPYSGVMYSSFPETIKMYGSNILSPSITNEAHWSEITDYISIPDPGGFAWTTWVYFDNPDEYSSYKITVFETITGTPDCGFNEIYLGYREKLFPNPADIPYRHYKLKITSSHGGTSSNVEFSDLNLDYDESSYYQQTVNYNIDFPVKIFDLPPKHEVTGVNITTISGYKGGYSEQVGSTVSGTYPISFITIVDRHNKLENDKSISQIGVSSDIGGRIYFRIFEEYTEGSTERFTIWDVFSVTHSGGGFQWFTLTDPYIIPSEGNHYLGWYQANNPRKMGVTGGEGKTSYQYGDYIGTNIYLPLHHTDFLPSLAVRYNSYFDLGITTNSGLLLNNFSPARNSKIFNSSNTLGPYYDETVSIYLGRPSPVVEPNTQGSMLVTIYYKEEGEDNYGLSQLVTIKDSSHKMYDHPINNAFDSDSKNYFSPEKWLDEYQNLRFMLRFYDPVYLEAFSVAPAQVSNGIDCLPDSLMIAGSEDYARLYDAEDWTDLYFDEDYSIPTISDWKPYIYFDDHTTQYRYYNFTLWHYGYPQKYGMLGGVRVVGVLPYPTYVTTSGLLTTVRSITGDGRDANEVRLLHKSGDRRYINNIWNTYTYNGRNEVSPGTVFLMGENNMSTTCPHPVSVIKEYNGNRNELPVSPVEFGGLNILAWHKFEEETGNFIDYSGNNINVVRVGNIIIEDGKRGKAAKIVDSDSPPKYGVFTLPHHLTEYSVSFWFRPVHDIYPGYPITFDIMGGWVSYGNVPGVWHISLGRTYLYVDSPYPFRQENTLPLGSSHSTKIFFGNYGKVIYTGREVWSKKSWHNIIFSFDSDGDYKVWEDGTLDYESGTLSSTIYPPPPEIIVNPADIHYDNYDFNNCMYYGLPWIDGQGAVGEFYLDHVMHFNKVFTDEEAFTIYRLKDNSEEWDGIYFNSPQNIELPSKLIFDFGQDISVNKYSFILSNTQTWAVPKTEWLLTASGEDTWEVLDNNYIELGEMQYIEGEYIEETRELTISSETLPLAIYSIYPGEQVIEVSFETTEYFSGGHDGTYGGIYNDPVPNPFYAAYPANRTSLIAGYNVSQEMVRNNEWISLIQIVNSVSGYIKFKLWKSSPNSSTHVIEDITDLLPLSAGSNSYNVHYKTGIPYLGVSPTFFPAFYATCEIDRPYGGSDQDQYNYKSGDITGTSTGWTNMGGYYTCRLLVYYHAPKYNLGLGASSNYFYTAVSFNNLYESPLTHSYPLPVKDVIQNIYIYSNNVVQVDTEGVLRLTIKKKIPPHNLFTDYVHNITNTKAYRHYAIELVGTNDCRENLELSGLRMFDTPRVPTVSGNSLSVTSGIAANNILECISDSNPGDAAISYAVSLDNIDWCIMTASGWEPVILDKDAVLTPSGLFFSINNCDWLSLGSGTLSIAHKFVTNSNYCYPGINSYNVLATDYTASGTGSYITYSGNITYTVPMTTTISSDWLHYAWQNYGDYHILSYLVDSGYLPIGSGQGYFVDTSYTCSGSSLTPYIISRTDDVIKITASTVDGLNIGNKINIDTVSGYTIYEVEDIIGNNIVLNAPKLYDVLPTDSYYRRIVTPYYELRGEQVNVSGTEVRISEMNEDLITLSGSFNSGDIVNISSSKITGSGILPTTISGRYFNLADGGYYFSPVMTSFSTPGSYTIATNKIIAATEDYTINATDTFPKKIFTLPKDTVLFDTIITVKDSFSGDTPDTFGYISSNKTDSYYNRSYINDGTTLTNGRLISHFCLWQGTSSYYRDAYMGLNIKIKLVKQTGGSNQYYDILDTIWEGVNPVYGDFYVYLDPPFRIPSTGIHRLCYCLGAANSFYAFGVLTTSRNDGLRYKDDADPTGNNVSFLYHSGGNMSYNLVTYYTSSYSVGTLSNATYFTDTFKWNSPPTITGSIGPFATETDVYMHRQVTVGHTAGAFNVSFEHSDYMYHLFDGKLDPVPTVTSGTALSIDMGSTSNVDGYRWYYSTDGEVNSPLIWSMYGSNELPYWSHIADETSVVVNRVWSSVFSLTPGYKYYGIRFYDDYELAEIEFVYRNNTTTSGIHLLSTTSGWGFSYVGKLSYIEANTYEPGGTSIYHAISFDNSNTFKIYKNGNWVDIVRYLGQWQYNGGGWFNAPDNTKYSAFRGALDYGHTFSSIELGGILDDDWYTTGGLTSTSGRINFINAMLSDGYIVPSISYYDIYYTARSGNVTSQWWANSLIPSGYAYTVVSGSPYFFTNHYDVPLYTDETFDEYRYDREYTNNFRLYTVNRSAATSVPLYEIMVTDVQTPDDAYRLELFSHVAEDCVVVCSGITVDTAKLTDKILRTGGIQITENKLVDLELSSIPRSRGLFYGDLRLYFDTALDRPSLISAAPSSNTLNGNISTNTFLPVSVSGIVFNSNYNLSDDHYSVYFWADSPVTKLAVRTANKNSVGTGLERITELGVFPIEYEGGWNVPSGFNLLETAESKSYVHTAFSAYRYQYLSTPHLERLFDTSISGALPIFGGYYIGVESSLNYFTGKARELRFVVEDNSDMTIAFYTQTSGEPSWTERTPTWSGSGYFYYTFDMPTNITATRVACLNTATGVRFEDIKWCRSIQLVNAGDEIDFGTTGGEPGVVDLPLYYGLPEIVEIFNNSSHGNYANARVLPRFSNNYNLDRNTQLSEDMVNWYGLNSGLCLPEDLPFETGTFVGTEISTEGTIKLIDSAVSGTWTSRVIEVLDPSSTVAYVYTENSSYDGSYVNKDYKTVMNIIEVRAADANISHPLFVTGAGTEPQDGDQLPWKAVAFDTSGNLLSWDGGNLNRGSLTYIIGGPHRTYSYYSRQPLWQFYGAMNSMGYGAYTAGNEKESIAFGPYLFYKLRTIYPYDYSPPSYAIPNENSLHIYGNTYEYMIPVFNKSLRYTTKYTDGVTKPTWQCLDVVHRELPFYERYQEYYFDEGGFQLRSLFTFNGDTDTPESTTEIDYICSLPGTVEGLLADSIRCAACIDGQVGDYYSWFHYAYTAEGEEEYKTLLLNGSEIVREWTNIERSFNYMVEAPPESPRGFWGIGETAVYWYEYDGTNLTEVFSVNTDGNKTFKLLTFGYNDYNNNLWVVDLATERVIRINFEQHSVDYSRIVDGACSVYPDAFDGSAYVYVLRDPEFPSNDCIKLVHATDYDYLVPEVVCAVPGIALIDPYNVNLYGRGHYPEGYYNIMPQDVVWKEVAGAEWKRYSSGSPTLPKGQYKQFRITLQRNDLDSVSPEVQYIRIPVPAVINKIPYQGYKKIYVDTLLRNENTALNAGDYSADLLVWWPRD